MNLELLGELEVGLAHIDQVASGDEPGDVDALFGAMLDRATQAAGSESPELGLVVRARASVYRRSGATARALAEYERALPLLERAGDEGRIQVMQTLTSIAALDAQLGNPHQASDTVRRAIPLIAEYVLDPPRFAPPRPKGTDPPPATAVARAVANDAADAVATSSDADRLDVFDELAQRTADAPAVALAFLIAHAEFDQAHRDPAAPASFTRAWTAAQNSRAADVPRPEQWVQLADVAIQLGRQADALEAARHLRALEAPRRADARFLDNAYQARRIEASAAYLGKDPAVTEGALSALRDFCMASFGDTDDRTIGAESSLSRFLTRAGRADEALEMLRHAARVCLNSPSYPDERAAGAVFDLADALDRIGEDTEAIGYYMMAYNIYARVLGPTDTGAVASALNLAETARIAHDHETAERWFHICLDGEQQRAGPRTWRIAHALNNLAETLLDAGRAGEAAPLADQALTLRGELFGEKSKEYKRSLGVVARAALATHNQTRIDEVIAKCQELSGSSKVELPVEVLMGFLEEQGDIDAAIAVCRQGLAVAGQPHDQSTVPRQQMSLQFALGNLCARTSHWKDAKQNLFEAFTAESTVLSDEAGLRSERQIHTMFAESRARIGTLLDVLANDPDRSADDVSQAYEVVQQRRALETRLIRLQKPSFITDRALTSVPQERLEEIKAQVSTIVQSLDEAREDWLAALIRQAEQGGPDPDDMSVVGRQDRVEWYERQLAGYVGQGSRDFEVFGVGASVPSVTEGSAVVEYVYSASPPRYYAFVVQHDAMQFTSLGEADQIHQALLQLRADVTDAPSDPGDPDPPWRRRSRFLANRLLKPLLPWLEGTTQLYVVPDSELFTLPFDLLPVEDGQMAIDRWTITHLWNGGELSTFNMHLGNPPAPTKAVVVSAPALADNTADTTWHFAPLPFADREGEAIASQIGAVRLPGPDATKDAVAHSTDAEILHFATHSFYVSAAASDTPPTDAPSTDATTPLLYRARSVLADPMLRSGIALAGADAELGMPTAKSPGILFASEVLNLDLRNTDLAVLSSCQSGLGDPQPGDGIHGLRRAFRAAGCSSVVSSLWKVPDEATHDFMIDFYARLLAKTPRGQALREAKLAMREHHADDPLFWAAFVLDGSDKPLFRFSGLQGFKMVNLSGVGLSYDAALDQMAHQQWDAAIKSLQFVLNSRTADDALRAKALLALGQVYRHTDRLDDAIQAYDRVIASIRTPADVRLHALTDRAIAKLMNGDLDGAYLDYTAALTLVGPSGDERAWLLVNRGYLLGRQDKPELAIADWSEAIANPASPSDQRWKALLNRADAYRRMERYGDAIADVTALTDDAASKGSSDREKAYIVLSLCRSEQGDMAGAIAAMRSHLDERTTPVLPGTLQRLMACKSAKDLQALAATLL